MSKIETYKSIHVRETKAFVASICILLSGLLFSCERFDDNRRILIKGQLINTEILNDDDIEVYATFDDFFGFDFDNDNVLSRTTISEDGTFDLIIPAPNDDEVYIQINPIRDTNTNELNTRSNLIVIVQEMRVSAQELIDIKDFELSENAFINLNFNKVSSFSSTLSWHLTYVNGDCVINFEDTLDNSITELCGFSRTVSDQLQDLDETVRIRSKLGTDAILSYTINDGDMQIINFSLDNTENNIEIEY